MNYIVLCYVMLCCVVLCCVIFKLCYGTLDTYLMLTGKKTFPLIRFVFIQNITLLSTLF